MSLNALNFSYIGDKVERHAAQFEVMGNLRVLRKRCIRHNNVMTRLVSILILGGGFFYSLLKFFCSGYCC